MTETGTSIRYVRLADRLPDDQPLQLGPIQVAPILGDWKNSNPRSRGVTRFVVSERDGQLWVHIWADDPQTGETWDWGEAVIETLYGAGLRSTQGSGFTARFDHGHARTFVQSNQNHGITVLALSTTFTDGSGRANYFNREFYSLQQG
jgi:hypothetical protein